LQAVVVRLGLRVRLVEALVARATGELCQHVSVGADPVIGNSGCVLPNLRHVRDNRLPNQIDLQLFSSQYGWPIPGSDSEIATHEGPGAGTEAPTPVPC